MKKVLLLGLLAIMVLAGCSSNSKESSHTLDDYIKAYTDQGVEVDPENKPVFAMIGAINGVLFYYEKSPVKIYEYKSSADLKKSVSADSAMKDWPSAGKFLLETKNEKAMEIFESVK